MNPRGSTPGLLSALMGRLRGRSSKIPRPKNTALITRLPEEILSMITAQLRLQDMVALLETCTALRTSLEPRLYHSISVYGHNHNHARRLFRTLHDRPDLCSLVHSFNSPLVGLFVPQPHQRLGPEPTFKPNDNRYLFKLRHAWYTAWSRPAYVAAARESQPYAPETAALCVFESMTQLESLTLTDVPYDLYHKMAPLLQSLPSLHMVDIDVCPYYGDPDPWIEETLPLWPSPNIWNNLPEACPNIPDLRLNTLRYQ